MSDCVEVFDLETASGSDLEDCFAIHSAATRIDRPEDPAPTLEVVVSSMRIPVPELGPDKFWSIRAQGHLVGIMRMSFPTDENRELALTNVTVHPDHRRAGRGTRLLGEALAEAARQGRNKLVGAGLKCDGPGDKWAASLGFHETERKYLQFLQLSAVDHQLWISELAAGYRLEQWVATAPDELVGSYSLARLAIEDGPRGGTSYREPQWSVRRVRQLEQEYREEGISNRVVAAIDQSSGEVVGFTETWVYPDQPNTVIQGDTAVVSQHRGRGLGRTIKTAMLRWLTGDLPDLETVYTNNTADNVHMIKINHSIGFENLRTTLWVESNTESLQRRLSSASDKV